MNIFRLLILILFIYLCIKLVRELFLPSGSKKYKAGSPFPGKPAGYIDEMVQDPECEVYVPKREALTATVGGKTHFFCSKRCIKKFMEKKS